MMVIFGLLALLHGAIPAPPLPTSLNRAAVNSGPSWSIATKESLSQSFPAEKSQTPRDLLPATMHAGTVLRRDAVPFVGKVFLKDEHGGQTQFTCVLTGSQRRACVTVAHNFLAEREPTLSFDRKVTTRTNLPVTIEFDACEQVYAAESIELATTEIDSVTENNREKDVAVIVLSEPACDRIDPANLLPELTRQTAEKWLLPGAATRVPVTIAAYYMDCTLGSETFAAGDTCEQYSSTGYIDSMIYLAGEPIYETTSIGTLPGSSGAPGLVIDTGQDARSRRDDTYFWICLNVGHRPDGKNACIALENGSFARKFIESRFGN